MNRHARRSVLALVTGAALVGGTAMSASADNVLNDGLVNLTVGRITITDLNVGVAAQVAAAICGVDVGPIAVIGNAVDAGTPGPVLCDVVNQPVKLVQN
jgi:hypothetical protein